MRVSCRKEGAVWRVRMEPGAGETVLIDPAGVQELASILDDCDEDASCRVLLLEGTPTSFCEGLDIQSVLGLPRSEMEHAVRCFGNCLRGLRSARPLVISAVEGAVAGGGVGLAGAADVVIATTQASFVLPELSLGLLPAIVLPVLLERLPPQKARLLAVTERLDGAQAHAAGLVDRLAAGRTELESTLRATIKHALRLSPTALHELKQLAFQVAPFEFAAAIERGTSTTLALLTDPTRVAPIRAFLEGERPPWFHRWRP
jgi:enoyl-CoA hydratase/carnithine racemase